MRIQRQKFFAPRAVLMVLALSTWACTSDNKENTPGSDGGASSGTHKDAGGSAAGSSGGSGGKAGQGGGSGNDDGGGLPDGAVRLDGGGVQLTDGRVLDPCEGAHGCFNCAAKTDLEYLNHCTSAQCEPFDNKARLLGYTKAGKLPALP